MNEHFFLYNTSFYSENESITGIHNRAFKYGDGLFETMCLHQGEIVNFQGHFQRLSHGMQILQMDCPPHFNYQFLKDQIQLVLDKNGIQQDAKIRLMVFRKGGSLFEPENDLHYIIETWPLDFRRELNSVGLKIDIYPEARKSCDVFSNLKTNNYLPSLMAALFASKNNLQDALVLNAYGRIAESAIANLFIIKGGVVYTPPLSEGCIAGIIRHQLLNNATLAIIEKPISVQECLDADEIFLTNSLHPIRWVSQLGTSTYSNEKIKEIYKMAYEEE